MNKKDLEEVIACLPKNRTVFRYAAGDYALLLLSRFVRKDMPVGRLRQSDYGRLLNKLPVKDVLSTVGNGRVSGNDFEYAWVENRQDFLLTLGSWNKKSFAYNQTTRNSGNLVLQVNFNTGHDSRFDKITGPAGKRCFANYGHPVLQQGERDYFRNTMAWVRMDIEFATGEVLIEEVQTDWLRNARYYLASVKRAAKRSDVWLKELVSNGKVESVEDYVEQMLAPYMKIWAEAALTAAIRFVVDELGIRSIYYHSFETGNALKRIRYSYPPRSLYTDLPRRFCFRLTDEMPAMLTGSRMVKRKLKKVKQPCWHRLEI
ncbi:MAG: hypothetical protein V3W04_04850 [Gammaproteobacteria bacterium]